MTRPREWGMARLRYWVTGGLLLAGLLAAGGLAPTAHAQTGKLAGTIVDDAGEPLIGVTAVIVGTNPPLGAAADISGDYSILRIPVGTYSVRFSSVGYQTRVVEGVLIPC